MNISAVIFDMDGTILDTEPLYRRTAQLAAMDCGVAISDELYPNFCGRPRKMINPFLKDWFGDEFSTDMFWSRFNEHHDTVFDRRLPLKPGVFELMDFLAAREIPLALATSSDIRRARKYMGGAGILQRFSKLATGDEVKNGKPDPEIFLLAASRLDIPAARCLVLEDSEAGILAAHRAGMRVVGIPDLRQPAEEIAALADHIVTSLTDVIPLLNDVDSISI